MNIIFFLRKAKINKKNEMPVNCLLTVNKQQISFSVGVKCTEQDWDKVNKRIKKKSIYEKGNIEIDKINHRFFLIKTNHNIAEKYLTIEQAKAMLLEESDDNKKILSQCLNEYLLFLKVEKEQKVLSGQLKSTKYLNGEFHINNLLKTPIATKRLKELNKQDFENVKALLFKTYKSAYVAQHLRILKGCLEYAVEKEYIDKNPFGNIPIPQGKKSSKRGQYLSLEEIKRLEEATHLSKSEQQARDMFLFCCFTGLAFIDYSNLQSSYLEKIENTIFIIKQREKGETNDYGKFTVPIFSQAQKIIDKYGGIDQLPKKKHTTYYKILKRIKTKIGFAQHIYPHLARHTFIWLCLNEWGYSQEAVMAMVGHSTTIMLYDYARPDIRRIMKEMRRE